MDKEAVTWSELLWKSKVMWICIMMLFVGAVYILFQQGKVQAYAHTLPNGKQAITAHFAFPPENWSLYLNYDASFDFEECIVSEYQGPYKALTFSVGKPKANEWVLFSKRSLRSTDKQLWKMNVTFVNPSDPETFLKAVKFRYLVRRSFLDPVRLVWPHRYMKFNQQ